MSIVKATGLVKRYDRTLAVGGLDLDVEQGEIFGLVGPNGAGKTTTLRILATLLRARRRRRRDRGRVASARNPNDVRRVLGFMPDSFGVYDDMKVWEYLDFFARCYGIPAAARRRMIGDLLDLVDLGPKRDAYVQGLSRGMQQRLCLAHALVHDPQVLLLDEPASGLDPRARVELRELLRELRSLGKTILSSAATSFPSSRSCAPRSRSSTAARCSPRAGSTTSSGACGSARCSASGSSATTTRSRRPAPGSRPSPTSPRRDPARRPTIELGFRGDDDGVRRGCSPRRLAPGCRIATFAPAASDLEELFLQVTAQEPVPVAAPRTPPSQRRLDRPVTAATARPRRLGALRDVFGGISAIAVKELRGRMRGRRAFVDHHASTCCSLAGFAWMVETLMERTLHRAASAQLDVRLGGHRAGLFAAHADAADAHRARPRPGVDRRRDQPRAREADARPARHDADLVARDRRSASSSRRSSWVLLLSLASIPVTALVFMFGGVGPDDMVKGYVVLLVDGPVLGSVGLFVSALVKRTQAATVINLVTVIALTAGTRVHASSSGRR